MRSRQRTSNCVTLLLFVTTLLKGHDAIVLSAFGCGAFGNPPEHIATLFKEIIDTEISPASKCIS